MIEPTRKHAEIRDGLNEDLKQVHGRPTKMKCIFETLSPRQQQNPIKSAFGMKDMVKVIWSSW